MILKTLLDAGDEVLTPAPFFVEYRFYAENHNGRLVPVATGRISPWTWKPSQQPSPPKQKP
ncbi:MAG: hypothetical protein R2875_00830 [Desulfobacterales bacterium]